MVAAVAAIVVETILFVTLIRFVYRMLKWVARKLFGGRQTPPGKPLEEQRKVA
jgi:hypothetical protein